MLRSQSEATIFKKIDWVTGLGRSSMKLNVASFKKNAKFRYWNFEYTPLF